MIGSAVQRLLLLILLIAAPGAAMAALGAEAAWSYLWIAILLLVARFSALIERLRQPGVLGELLAGIVLGNLVLVGIGLLEPIKHDPTVKFLAELGVVILLFQIGLETNVHEMRRVGNRALLVACVGVIVPFVLGTAIVGPLLFADQSFNLYLFLGATLTATSVGITARVFKDLHYLQSAEARIVLGAAVIDDVLGLIILAVVAAIITTGSVAVLDIVWITLKAFLFLGGAILIGHRAAPLLSLIFSRIHSGVAMKLTVALALCLSFAFIAQSIGLAPIVGAFAAGLILDEVTFKDFSAPAIFSDVRNAVREANAEVRQRVHQVLAHHGKHHLQELIDPISHLLVPLFFVYTGMQVNLAVLADPGVVIVALVVTVVAIAGKLASGLAAGASANKWLVGWAMVPRGEVGLIFAVVGKGLGVIDDVLFSVFVIMVMLTTLVTPPILAYLIRHRPASAVVSSRPMTVE
ncbi:MAG: cation:proton antiporter [Gammaproteobacteria bacterium]